MSLTSFVRVFLHQNAVISVSTVILDAGVAARHATPTFMMSYTCDLFFSYQMPFQELTHTHLTTCGQN